METKISCKKGGDHSSLSLRLPLLALGLSLLAPAAVSARLVSSPPADLAWFAASSSPLPTASLGFLAASPARVFSRSIYPHCDGGARCASDAFRASSPSVRGAAADPGVASTTSCSAYKLTFGGPEAGETEGRVALVTGASRGIGKAIADTLAEAGVSHLLCVARQQAACDEAAADLRSRGFSASGHAVDVGDGQAVSALCEDLLKQYPHIDILVNNAGITRDNLFIRMSDQEWHDVINTNLNSAFYFSSHIIKRMVKNRFGRIINISSVIGVGGNPGQANYAASKAGMIGLTRTLGKEYANRNITVNAIAPGFIRSAMTDKMPEAAKKQALSQIPANRLGEPKDVAALAAFLASDQAGYITGKVIPVDGGMLFGGN
ncbi:3-ketoacyl-(Acyl-carrier-protein) reductase, related [Neospora caninum Liverpool]|uniref:3-oxoacyl-[acyl-carrier-protein] reductase n=1 Tax=Neospora caninum (strain Liverpool) TaxID=572307 RepID=F0VQ29_NEOCL|nr:3-ketoacyl-(Acyl-carrier-protein) reductase, related [Neospora caninum Liverpool]CBZ55826.1 3-ketoacyl-(Acyl-carrier-protein) reductase, related [Neospora caninum Liverpool]CEL70568.1 TPA: 3-ketoacyl-(Acyl-carrier-protein) reductase, related [Neospora caninum Liverpool]|eukprot:XP_003885852.1 3-ketoacyl-(Acyl-carrier-protein) reductase, related [Neospora caninum Liverpool]